MYIIGQDRQPFMELSAYLEGVKDKISASAAASIIVHNDKIVYEWYSGFHSHAANSRRVDERSQFNVASIRKTYLALIVSLALYEGKIRSLDDRIVDYLEDKDSDWLADTTIRHLLTHTHGLLDNKRSFAPGTAWNYNNTGVNLLIQLIERLYGRCFTELVHELVLAPYEFSKTSWSMNKQEELIWLNEQYTTVDGTESNLFVSARDLMQWGMLHLKKGLPQSHLPQEVFEQATTMISPSIDEHLPRNGFFWFVQDQPRPMSEIGDKLPQGTFQSLGITGCACLVIPEIDTVAVRMYNQMTPNPADYHYLTDIKHFGDKVYEAVLAAEKD